MLCIACRSMVGAKTAFIELGSPWENGDCGSFGARFRDELLIGKIFYSLREAQILIEQRRGHYNTARPPAQHPWLPPACLPQKRPSRSTRGRLCANNFDGPPGGRLQHSEVMDNGRFEPQFLLFPTSGKPPQGIRLCNVDLSRRFGYQIFKMQ